MPYIKEDARVVALEQGLRALGDWLITVPVEQRKGFVAYCVMFLGKHCFTNNYFGKSTGTDAVRSALTELEVELCDYEIEKKEENGDV